MGAGEEVTLTKAKRGLNRGDAQQVFPMRSWAGAVP